MYIKPKLERFGTFRELTLEGIYTGGDDILFCTDKLLGPSGPV